MAKFCANCGTEMANEAVVCIKCGTMVNGSTNTGINTNTVNTNGYISVKKVQNMNKLLLKKRKK